MLAFSWSAANDAVTAILVIAVGAVLRGIWSLQQKVSRLEGLDEMRERQLSADRGDDPAVRSPGDHLSDQKED